MKGQYFSFDAIVASVIFVLALMALLSYWHGVRSYLDYQNSDVQKEAVRISNLLFTPPQASAYLLDCDNVERMGFSDSWNYGVVNWTLLDLAQDCTDADAQWLRQRLSSPYNLTMTITYPEAPPWSPRVVEIGSSPADEATEIVKMRRLATVETGDGTTYLATIDLRLYR